MRDHRLDFLVIGAQKCATSWLYMCLKDHPQLHLPAKKREVEYLGGDLYQARGGDWYFGLLQGAKTGQKTGDVSVQYLFDPRSPGIVHDYAPEVKLIVSMRDPIDRAISAYYWGMRKGHIPNLDLRKGLRIAVDGERQSGSSETEKYYRDIISRGFYDLQLERYLNYFSPEQLLVVLYEDIKENPLAVIEKIYEFIGVDSYFVPRELSSRPKHNTYLNPLIRFERIIPRSPILGKLMDVVSSIFYRLRVQAKKPRLDDSLVAQLSGLYRPHVERVQRIMDKLPEGQRPFSFNLAQVWCKQWDGMS